MIPHVYDAGINGAIDLVYDAIELLKNKMLSPCMLHLFSDWVGLPSAGAAYGRRMPPKASKAAKKAFNDAMREAAKRTVRKAAFESEKQLRGKEVYAKALAKLRKGGPDDEFRPLVIVLKDEQIFKVFYCYYYYYYSCSCSCY